MQPVTRPTTTEIVIAIIAALLFIGSSNPLIWAVSGAGFITAAVSNVRRARKGDDLPAPRTHYRRF